MLPLPISLATFHAQIYTPAMALLPARLASRLARLQVTAIGLQESDFADRRQGPVSRPGPARGLWQFEVPGVQEVMTHRRTQALAREVCRARGAPWQARSIHRQLEYDDLLACAFARLLLWSDPHPLPEAGDVDGAFDGYVRNWKPGAVRTLAGARECLARWRHSYARALEGLDA